MRYFFFIKIPKRINEKEMKGIEDQHFVIPNELMDISIEQQHLLIS